MRRVAVLGGAAAAGSQVLLLLRQPSWRPAAAAPRSEAPHPEVPGPPQREKTAFVVGAGVAGICSAYRLAKRGYEVIVLDALDGAAAEGSASAAAAGGMDTLHKFSGPSDWRKMFGQLLPGGDGGFRFFYISWLDVLGDLFFWRWLANFARESLLASASHVEQKKASFLPVVEWGIEETIRTMREVPGLQDAAHFSQAGSVMVIGSATGGFANIGTGGTVSLEEVKAFEPLLAEGPAAAAAHEGHRFLVNPQTRFGECVNFTRHLAAHCEQHLPVRIVRGTAARGFCVRGDRVAGIHTSRGYVDVGAGSVVLCGGAWSGILCDMLGVYCPIYPLKGYTLLVELEGARGLTRLAYDAAVYAVPAGPRLRVASIGGLGGWSVATDPAIEAAVKAEAEHLLPALAEKIRRSSAVAGLRPFSADEMPLVGRLPGFSNVLLNTGPGHTGWKCSAGFAEILAAAASGGGDAAVPGSRLLDPAGRVGAAATGPRLLRGAQEAVRAWAPLP